MEGRAIKIASRESALAMVQAHFIRELIGGEIVGITSEGDINLQSPLYSMPGIGIFVKQLEIELLSGRADLAAHCLKDMPTTTTEGLVIAAILPFNTLRGDVAVLKPGVINLESLPNNSIIGTSSLRRQASLAYKYPHKAFRFQNIRGNLNTRIKKLESGEYDCIILAAAGIARLNLQDTLNIENLEDKSYLYAPGQAALALECRENDHELIRYLKTFECQETRLRCLAERAFMKDLEGVRII
jgi:hydroxymethylbilane synthase